MKKYDLFIYYIIILLFSLSEGKNKRIIIEGKEEGNCKVKRGTEKKAETVDGIMFLKNIIDL